MKNLTKLSLPPGERRNKLRKYPNPLCMDCGSPDAYQGRCRVCKKRRDDYQRRLTSQQRWAARNPEKKAAHNTLNGAVRAGKLQRQPCQECGNPRGEAHHHDYHKPLDVTWLCRGCHASEHAKNARQSA